MVGRGRPRKRAPSVSTVATIDDSSIRYLRESVVLKPVSPHAHADDWPCFLLSDATVYHRDGSIANLLHVDLEGPFIVRGRLEVEKDLEKYLVNRPGKSKNPWIQIESSTSFSIGQGDDRGLPLPVLWASGQSGWFEIDPSDKYKPISDFMFQGVNLHYSILGQYEEELEKLHKSRKHRSKTFRHIQTAVEDLLFQYAITTGDGITLPEAQQRCAEQALFLLSHFPRDTAFYHWLASQFPDIVEKLAKKEPLPAQPVTPSTHPMLRAASSSLEIPDHIPKDHATARSSTQRATRNSESAGGEIADLSSDGQQLLNDRAARLKKRSPANAVPGKSDVEMADAADGAVSSSRIGSEQHGLPVLLGALNGIRESILEQMQLGKAKKHPDQMTPSTIHFKVYLACRIKHRFGSSEVCEYFVRDLVRLLGPEWHQSEFYKWAQRNFNTTPKFQYVSEAECLGLTRRAQRQPKAATEETGEPSYSAKQPAPEPAPEPAGKQPPKKRGRPSGKAAGLRPSLGGQKRPRTDDGYELGDMDIDGYEAKKTTKKSRYFFDDNEFDDNDDDDADSSAAEDGEQQELEGGATGGSGGPPTRLVIRAERLPSMAPKGPNQTWTCEEPECGYVVRAADEEDGQNLITAHFEEHEKEARDEAEEAALKRVNLAKMEAGRNMPINHLLEKIRTMGEKNERRNEVKVNGQPVPQPIKRTLLV